MVVGLLTGPAMWLSAPASQAHEGHDHEAAAQEHDFQQVTLARGRTEVGEPMTLAVLPDNSVLHTSRNGEVRLTDEDGTTTVAGALNVYSHDEEGLQGVGVDPGFEQNRFVYLYYAPPLDTPAGDAPENGTAEDFASFDGVNRLSRFTLSENGKLDVASETKILEVPASRGMCCHAGGDIDFDAEGNLYLSTGDDTNPFQSDGYTPIDERADRNPSFDAQRTSANTNDLRGKILRIRVNADGSYNIPEGNLFAPGTEKTKPEIYAMGFRNPFRMSVDKATGIVYVGDYGPDAGGPDPARGPGGQVEFARITEAGNFGWPYCTGDNDPYVDYDFGDKSSGATFDCSAPVNDSPRNTGLTELPPAQAAWIPYDGNSVPEFGNGSESPMGGPVYREAEVDPDSAVKFPSEYEGDFFGGEYGRQWIKRIEQGDDGAVQSISDFPWDGTQVMDMDFGPDGALYVLDYGTGTDNAALYRIENVTGGRAPVAEASADVTSGHAPLSVAFSSAGTADPDSTDLTYHWDFGDGATSEEHNPSHTYAENGTYDTTLTVTDPEGHQGSANVQVVVGNTAPKVNLTLPRDGQLFSFGDKVPFEVTVDDPEDQEIDCSKVQVTYAVGHDSHAHPITSANGCTGTIQTTVDGEHDPNANLYGHFTAEYTDGGGSGQGSLTGTDVGITQPRNRQAEHFTDSQGIGLHDKSEAHGGKTVGSIHHGDWIAFDPYAISDAGQLTARVSSAGIGGTLEVRAGAPDGKLLGSADVPVTGGWAKFQNVATSLSGVPEGTTKLYLVFTGSNHDDYLFDVDDFTFQPKTQQAEHYTDSQGIWVHDHNNAHGGKTLGSIHNGDWIAFEPYDLSDATKMTARVSSAGIGGTLEVRAGAPDGTLLGSTEVPVTGSWEEFQDVTVDLTGGAPEGPTKLYLVFTGGNEDFLFDVDDFSFTTTPYTSLFNGTSTEGWKMAGPGTFRAENGTLVSEGGLGLLWYEAKKFTSYSLKLDWKMPGDDNSGVFVGFPPSDNPWSAMDNGYEVQIDATDDDDSTTGAVYNVQAPDIAARDGGAQPAGGVEHLRDPRRG
ncbi:carbohydrate-binding protein [Streptomyces sp. AHA2]|uniref:carbohydrate-binding protein n=1 Tax=Streptomyces sp. AHA2 TaxID=3064526 RepID=UPI002FE135A4